MTTKNKTPEGNLKAARKYRTTEKGKRKRRDWSYRKNFGITLEDYEAKLAEQDGLCAICRNTECSWDPGKKNFCVDHNHKTGEVRDLLCDRCNFMVGYIETNMELLPDIMRYLQRHNGKDYT